MLAEYLPHIVTILVAVVTSVGTILIASKRTTANAKTEITKTQITDQQLFRAQLMEEVGILRERLLNCERQCSECHKEHESARLENVKLTHQILTMEQRLATLEAEE